MNTAGVIVLGLAAATLAVLALWTRRVFFSALMLAGAGVFVAVLLALAGAAGLGVAALACTWGVAASGLVVGSTLSETERAHGVSPARGPWALALLASALLTASLALGVLAVDWPGTRARDAAQERLAATRGARAGAAAVTAADWLLAACAASGALALFVLAPAREEQTP
jgi:hypothetical protein